MMNKKTKLIVSAIGIAALAVPVLLLIFVSRTKTVPPVSSGVRQIDTQNIENTAKSAAPQPVFASPSPSTPSASLSPESSQSSLPKP